MNPGGIRTDLTFAQTKYPDEVPGDVTYEEAFSVQPFNNFLVSMDLTGQDIYDILAQQVTGTNGRRARSSRSRRASPTSSCPAWAPRTAR